MPRKRYKSEEIVAKLRQVDVLVSPVHPAWRSRSHPLRQRTAVRRHQRGRRNSGSMSHSAMASSPSTSRRVSSQRRQVTKLKNNLKT
jgi:crotonobetainyl-CoA:carnitine CoA-transferase CaiB-like acyl-CoA transferase